MQKINDLELLKLTKTETETDESTKKTYQAVFENSDGVKLTISQDKEFDLVLNEKYTVSFVTPQTKL
jgi:hypothetical protein